MRLLWLNRGIRAAFWWMEMREIAETYGVLFVILI